MALLGELDASEFLARHWQREPLLVRAALPEVQDLVDGDTLAGLAGEDVVEARIVVHDPVREAWSCEHGPFEAERFARLPRSGWTLLVNAVDHWLPEAAALLEPFDFLPRWRIDDVMFSYAVPGGGVGPHFDFYDVFLIQISGERRWQLGGRCDAHTPLAAHRELRLLEAFEPVTEHRLGPGDMLYLPAGIAHRGEAASPDCITCSVGFRAPAHGELLAEALSRLTEGIPEDRRYRDGPGPPPEDRHCLDGVGADVLADAWRSLAPADVESALARAFGALVTEPRHPELIEPAEAPTHHALAGRLARDGAIDLTHHVASRFAWRTVDGGAELFVDGEAIETSVALARAICAGRLERAPDADGWSLIVDLIGRGSLAVD